MAQFKGTILLQLVVVVCISIALTAMAADPDPLRDFCIADPYLPCKNPANVTSADFFYKGMAKPVNPNGDPSGVVSSNAMIDQWPTLHTLALSMVRTTNAEGGVVTLHMHPRSTEMLYVMKGVVYAGFVGTNNKLYEGVLEKGHVVIFPRGLVHFSVNVGKGTAYAISGFNSENPGNQFIPQTLFGSSNIGDVVLAEGFGISQKTVESLKDQIKAKFGKI